MNIIIEFSLSSSNFPYSPSFLASQRVRGGSLENKVHFNSPSVFRDMGDTFGKSIREGEHIRFSVAENDRAIRLSESGTRLSSFGLLRIVVAGCKLQAATAVGLHHIWLHLKRKLS